MRGAPISHCTRQHECGIHPALIHNTQVLTQPSLAITDMKAQPCLPQLSLGSSFWKYGRVYIFLTSSAYSE